MNRNVNKEVRPMNGRFVINRSRAKVMGVCAGLADWLNVDVLAVRLGVVVATLITGPVAVLIYILTGWLASDDR
jgi:phage shock protein C